MTERRRLAVVGSPVAHSLSPRIHAAAYRELGLDWSYEAIPVESGRLAEFVDALGPEWRGLSVTMPLKLELLELMPDHDDVSLDAGQANTLLLSGDRRRAFNTDVGGILRAIERAGVGTPRRVVILGGGATAASALRAAEEWGADITVGVRSPERARGTLFYRGRARVEIVGLGSVRFDGVDLVIATIPGGVELGLDIPPLVPQQTLLDAVYDPWPTPLAADWSRAGGRALRGTEMLVEQALLQVRIFLGGDPAQPVPGEDAVLRVMRGAVGGS